MTYQQSEQTKVPHHSEFSGFSRADRFNLSAAERWIPPAACLHDFRTTCPGRQRQSVGNERRRSIFLRSEVDPSVRRDHARTSGERAYMLMFQALEAGPSCAARIFAGRRPCASQVAGARRSAAHPAKEAAGWAGAYVAQISLRLRT